MKRTLRKRWHQRLRLMICMSLCAGSLSTAYSATPDSFKTQEYYDSTGLNLIKAADAYALGYTGKGITLGIFDDYVKFSHPEFSRKLSSRTTFDLPDTINWEKDLHGTHVAGIMAADKNNVGMHGVAFDADLLSGAFVGGSIKPAYDVLNQYRHIKIINNSWGADVYPDEVGKQFITDALKPTADVLEDSIIKHDKVLVFASGNNGHPTSGGESTLSYILDSRTLITRLVAQRPSLDKVLFDSL